MLYDCYFMILFGASGSRAYVFYFAQYSRKFPELFTWFKEFLGYKDSSPMESMTGYKERTSGELAHLEIGKTFSLFIKTMNLTNVLATKCCVCYS